MNRYLRRRINRLFSRPKSVRLKTQILKFQKFSLICYIGNSTDVNPEKRKQLFSLAVAMASEYFHKFLNWLLAQASALSSLLFSFFKDQELFMFFGVAISVALLLFRGEVIKMKNSFFSFLERKTKGLGCSLLILLLILIYLFLTMVTDLPVVPLKKTIGALISRIDTFVQNSEFSLEEPIITTYEPKYKGEKGKFVFLSLITVVFLRYLVHSYKYKLFHQLPFGNALIEIYENDMKKKSIQTS
jgi:hypothetical protein